MDGNRYLELAKMAQNGLVKNNHYFNSLMARHKVHKGIGIGTTRRFLKRFPSSCLYQLGPQTAHYLPNTDIGLNAPRGRLFSCGRAKMGERTRTHQLSYGLANI
jgi:hypothetical protein